METKTARSFHVYYWQQLGWQLTAQSASWFSVEKALGLPLCIHLFLAGQRNAAEERNAISLSAKK